MRGRGTLAGIAVLALALAGAACGESSNGDDGANTQTKEKVTYATSFGTLGRDAYVFVAKDKGYFDEAGLDVSIQPGNGTGELLKLISGGQVQFAPVDSTGLLLQVGGGVAKGVTAVAAIQQRSMAGIMTLDGRGISSPKDLEGKTFGEQPGGVNGLLLPTYAKLAGFDATKVKIVNIPAPQLIANLASGTVDSIGQFVVGVPTVEKAAGGKKAVLLPYSDYITDLYGNVLATSTTLAKDKPELVAKFRDALLKGLQYTIDHADEAGEILKKYQPQQDATVAAAEITLMSAYVRSASSGVPVGALDSQRVAKCIAILQGAGAIPAGLTPEQVISFELTPKA